MESGLGPWLSLLVPLTTDMSVDVPFVFGGAPNPFSLLFYSCILKILLSVHLLCSFSAGSAEGGLSPALVMEKGVGRSREVPTPGWD